MNFVNIITFSFLNNLAVLVFILPVLINIIFMVTSLSRYIWMVVLALYRYTVKRGTFSVLKNIFFYFSRLIPLAGVGNS